MILNMPFDQCKLVDFDTRRATISPVSSGTPKGNLAIQDSHIAALYSEDNNLVLQIDSSKWILTEGLNIQYHHSPTKKTTAFVVADNTDSFSLEYKAWWANIPDFSLIEPEMDEDEDFFAYIFAVSKNKSIQQALLKQWS